MRAGVLAGLCAAFYFLPLFHIVPLQSARQRSASALFDSRAFVEEFWNSKLLPSATKAVDVHELLAALHDDPEKAISRYGHRLGLSSTTGFLVAGKGRIVAVDERSVSIATNRSDQTDVVIETGPVFGNTIRDGSGLLDVNDFPNSRDFNAVSAEINRQVEERVLPQLKEKAVPGAAIEFAGCVDIRDPKTDANPLRLVPFELEIP